MLQRHDEYSFATEKPCRDLLPLMATDRAIPNVAFLHSNLMIIVTPVFLICSVGHEGEGG